MCASSPLTVTLPLFASDVNGRVVLQVLVDLVAQLHVALYKKGVGLRGSAPLIAVGTGTLVKSRRVRVSYLYQTKTPSTRPATPVRPREGNYVGSSYMLICRGIY